MDMLLIGEYGYREFGECVQWLLERAELTCVANVEEALIGWSQREVPRVIVFAQTRPGEISLGDVERIHAQAPLARLVVLLGSWCEGEVRSGKPWPGVMRVYWPEFNSRMGVLLGLTTRRERARWDLPRTSTEADLLLATPIKVARSQPGLAVVAARTHVTFETLAEACGLAGLAAVWHLPNRPATVQGASLALWDSSGWGSFEAEELPTFVGQVSPTPVIALVDFPRRHECEQMLALGVTAVVPKPFLLADLLWQMDQILGQEPHLALPAEAA